MPSSASKTGKRSSTSQSGPVSQPASPPCGVSDRLCMPEDARKRASRRLKIARGHLDAIVGMLDNPDAYCVDVLRQIKAVQGALSGAGEVVLRGHLEAHVATAHQRGDSIEIVEELMEALKYT
ncbi:hypothetical protein BOO71_0005062 [Deinococcus marmoris]|uniref:Copper-sensing transcriptional repressor CsoR n=2 Tax=Deinococcus marmoris TaxID=249408 RepID=A0A1U7P0I4_9DEIO|nr:hypothetical protein BOO71_0009409 [Deinococcus marmoris]OLV18674.1 hypothetical protein BOO71_0005062 [Deinococcus marmoris]